MRDRAGRGSAVPGAGPGRKRQRQRTRRPCHSPPKRSRDRPFSALNCAALPDDCSKPNCSVTRAAPSLGRWPNAPACSRRRTAARCFSTRLASCRRGRRPSCCARSRKASSGASARTSRARSMCAWWRRQTGICAGGRRPGASALDLLYRLDVVRITVRRCAIAAKTSPCSSSTSGRGAARSARTRPCLATWGARRYDWPGNVRELQNVLAALAVRSPRRGVVRPVPSGPMAVHSPDDLAARRRAARSKSDSCGPRWSEAAGSARGRPRNSASRRQGLAKLMARLGIREIDG